MTKQQTKITGFETPAKVMDGHIIVNPAAPERWWRWEVNDDHPLVLAYQRGQLAAGDRNVTPESRFGAGTIYRGLYSAVHGSGMAGSNLVRISGGNAENRSSDRLCVARDLLKRVDERMSETNRFIVKAICGEGRFFSAAVRENHVGFEKHVIPTVCLALDDLVRVIIALGLKEP